VGLPAEKASASAITPVFPRLLHSGGNRRDDRRRDNAVLGTAIFLGTETMVFAALISAFLILRAGAEAWPPAGQPRLPIGLTGINTLILLSSTCTMRRAIIAGSHEGSSGLRRWLVATAALGTTFLIVQGSEWISLLRFGLGASTSIYGATFYTLIGCHALHVFAGLVAVLATTWLASSDIEVSLRSRRLQACQLYWFFVVAVWPVLYLLVYLM
jgi:heme/copper-type cytochrome/quinol oxidase subunit 3